MISPAQCRGCNNITYLNFGDWCGKCPQSTEAMARFNALRIEYKDAMKKIRELQKRISELDDEALMLGF